MIAAALILLAVLAYLGRSLVMLASVAGLAFAIWFAHDKALRVQIFALLVGGVGASLAAEVIHLVHHVVIGDEPDHGGFWVSAFLVGLINVAAMLPAIAYVRWRAHRRHVR